jgi:hypothetical protein
VVHRAGRLDRSQPTDDPAHVDVARDAQHAARRLDAHRPANLLERAGERELGGQLKQPAAVQRRQAAGPDERELRERRLDRADLRPDDHLARTRELAELVEREVELSLPARRVIRYEGLELLVVARHFDDWLRRSIGHRDASAGWLSGQACSNSLGDGKQGLPSKGTTLLP